MNYIDDKWSRVANCKHLTENKPPGQWSSNTWKHHWKFTNIIKHQPLWIFCSISQTNTRKPAPFCQLCRNLLLCHLHAVLRIYSPAMQLRLFFGRPAGRFLSVEHWPRLLERHQHQLKIHNYTILYCYHLLPTYYCTLVSRYESLYINLIAFWEGFLFIHTTHLLTFKFHIRSRDLRACYEVAWPMPTHNHPCAPSFTY